MLFNLSFFKVNFNVILYKLIIILKLLLLILSSLNLFFDYKYKNLI